jgi:chromosome segregation ATPase
MASASALGTLTNNFNTLQTSYNTLSGEFSAEKEKVSTLQNNMTSVQTEVAKLSDVTGKVGEAISAAVLVETNRATTEEGKLGNRISTLESTTATNTSNIATNTADIATLKAAVGEGGSISESIGIALSNLDADVTSTDGSNVNVQVIEVDGKITEVKVSDSSASSQALNDEISRATSEEGKLSAAINAEKSRIDVLYGVTAESQGDSGKSVRTIANEELAAQLLAGPDGAVDNFKTLQELAA